MSVREDYERQGYVVIPQGLPESALERLEAMTALYRVKDMGTDVHYVDGQLSSMHNLSNYTPLYGKCFDSLRPLAVELLGEPLFVTVFNASYFAKPPRVGLETKEHQDNAYFHLDPPQAVTCWVGLDDSEVGNGGLFYYKGSHRGGMLPHGSIGNLGASQAILDPDEVSEEYPLRFLTLKRGDVVIHHTLVIHGSVANYSDRPRRAFNFSFAGVSAKRNEESYARYRAQLESFIVKKRREAVHG